MKNAILASLLASLFFVPLKMEAASASVFSGKYTHLASRLYDRHNLNLTIGRQDRAYIGGSLRVSKGGAVKGRVTGYWSQIATPVTINTGYRGVRFKGKITKTKKFGRGIYKGKLSLRGGDGARFKGNIMRQASSKLLVGEMKLKNGRYVGGFSALR